MVELVIVVVLLLGVGVVLMTRGSWARSWRRRLTEPDDEEVVRPEPCPHLGLAADPLRHHAQPDGEHRCYLWMQRERVDLEHQRVYCLTSNHRHCPWLTISTPVPVQPTWRRVLDQGQAVATGPLPDAAAAVARFVRRGAAWAWPRLRVGARRAYDALRPAAIAAALWVRARGLEGLERARQWRARRRADWPVVEAPRREESRVARPRAAVEALGDEPGHPWGGGTTATPATPPPEPAVAVAPVRPAPAAALAVDPAAAAMLVQRGERALEEGNRSLARSLFVQACQADPSNLRAWVWSAALSESLEDRVARLQQVVTLDPGNARAAAALRAAVRQMHPGTAATAAVATGAEATVAPPGEMAPGTRRRGKKSSPAPASVAPLEQLLQQGVSALELGVDDLAYQSFATATSLYPTSEHAWFWRAKTAQDDDELEYCLRRVLEINPNNQKAALALDALLERRAREERRSRREAEDMARQRGERRRARRERVLRWMAGAMGVVATLAAVAVALVCLVSALLLILGDQADEVLAPLFTAVPALQGGLPTWDLDTVRSLGVVPKIEGFDLWSALPLTLAFLWLFVADGIRRGEPWAHGWSLGLTVVTAWLALSDLEPYRTGLLVALLSVAVGVGALLRLRYLPRYE